MPTISGFDFVRWISVKTLSMIRHVGFITVGEKVFDDPNNAASISIPIQSYNPFSYNPYSPVSRFYTPWKRFQGV